MESSEDVVLSNNTSIIVASPLINAFLISFGIISVGRLMSATSSYQSTSWTCGNFFKFFEFLNVLHIHVLDYDHGERTHTIFIYQNILTLYCLQVIPAGN